MGRSVRPERPTHTAGGWWFGFCVWGGVNCLAGGNGNGLARVPVHTRTGSWCFGAGVELWVSSDSECKRPDLVVVIMSPRQRRDESERARVQFVVAEQ